MTDDELLAVEQAASELARNAGKILMEYFAKPLKVSYKSANNRSPVTDADKASDDYVRGEIQRRFPDHALLSEEAEGADGLRSRVTWIVDPLDGTNNFLNRLPIFGVCIGVVEGDRPVAGAIFIPSIHSPEGSVFHARLGGGAKLDGAPLTLGEGQEPGNSQLSAMPTYFGRMFNFRPALRGRLGEVRSTGSVAYEMAMVSQGVFKYVVFSGPKIWDVAAGLVLVQEAGGLVQWRPPRTKEWRRFERLDVQSGAEPPTQGELRRWSGSLVVGTKEAATFVSAGLGFRSYRFRRVWRRARRLFRRPPSAQQREQTSGATTEQMVGAEAQAPVSVAEPDDPATSATPAQRKD
jgi:fructose-1,6-bisphosphatase/inositol monophosphatase family enzyme